MSLTPGTRLGVFEIAAQIGERGMGQMYLATDTPIPTASSEAAEVEVASNAR